jgi:hypothetical protein
LAWVDSIAVLIRTIAARSLRKIKERMGWRADPAGPHFLCIGAQKSGTTSFYQILRQHEEIYLPENKEIHYFTKFYDQGSGWYREQFAEAPPGRLRGEITPYYLFHEAVPGRILAFRPGMMLIALVRDPVERTISQYFHSCRYGFETLALREALAAETERLAGSLELIHRPGAVHQGHQEFSYLARSRYEQQLQRYRNLFGPQRLLVLRSEDLFRSPAAVLRRLADFLAIGAFPAHLELPWANPGEQEANGVDDDLRQEIRDRLAPTYAWMAQTYGITW